MEVRRVRVEDLIDGLAVELADCEPGREVRGLTDDSRRVEPGWAYVVRHAAGATQGTVGGDNAGYVSAAIAAGAAAVIDVRGQRAGAGRPGGSTPGVQSRAGALAARFHGRPSEAVAVVGVTGTNGKTTVATLTRALLRSAGIGCGLIGTIATDVGDGEREAALTTPGAIELQGMLAAMRDRGLRAAAIEVSSHALEQGRADAVGFAAGVFTNLSGDHLDYHGTMAAYGEAKAGLLSRLSSGGVAVVNVDDAWAASMMARVPEGVGVVRCSLREGAAADARVAWAPAGMGMRLTLGGPWGQVSADVAMVGEHNAMNVLQATAAAWAVGKTRGMTADDLARGLAELPVVAGRLEVVTPTASRRGGRDWRANGEGGGLPLVVVDYAHTDDALGKALAAVRPVADRRGGRLAVVFGCGGDRDRSKRPRMMRAACAGADDVWVTSDNPRTEDPRAIVEEVLTGRVARGGLAVASEVDRAAAIGRAIAAAAAADVVLIAGKGHETYQVVGKVKRHFDDREVAAEALVRWKERA